MDEETKNFIADFFDVETLMDYLELTPMDIVNAFIDEERFEEAFDRIIELMGITHE